MADKKLKRRERYLDFQKTMEEQHRAAAKLNDDVVRSPATCDPGSVEKQILLTARYQRGVPLHLEG